MKILVANLGSTSFKYRLFDMTDEQVLARGGVERIGSDRARCYVQAGAVKEEAQLAAQDHAVAVRLCLQQLSDPRLGCLKDPAELAAIGFKAVHAQGVTGVQRVDDRVLAAMEAYAEVAPAHNPPYVAAMRLLARELPQLPLVAAFETGFHETIPRRESCMRFPRSGRRSTASNAGAFTEQVIATLRSGPCSSFAIRERRSSRVIWAAAVRCVRSTRANPWRPAWA